MPTKTTTTYVDGRRYSASNINTPNGSVIYPNWYATPLGGRISLTSTRTDSGPVHGYKQLIRNGREATSSLTGTKLELDIVPGFIAYGQHDKTKPNIGWFWHFRIGNAVMASAVAAGTVASLTTTAQNEAKSKYIQKCIEAQTAFNGSQFLGELRESLAMIRNPAKALRSGLDDYLADAKRRRRGSPSQRRRYLSESWLEYQFGWKPLINDINSASKQLERYHSLRPPYQRVEGIGSTSSGTDIESDVGSGAFAIPVMTRDRQVSTVKYYGLVNIDLAKGSYLGSQHLGFRWDQFVPTLWELIPYSFLVDYFTNIGDILQSWSYARSNVRWTSLTTVREHFVEKWTLNPYIEGGETKNPDIEKIWFKQPCSSRASARLVSRTPAEGTIVPSLELSLPAAGSLKWLNLAALARTHRGLTPY